MRNLFGTVFIVLTMIIVAGCTDEAATTENMEGSTYTGVTPCADCEGIFYELSLDKDKTFEASSTYLGESNRPFIDRGSWKIKNDTLLILQPDSGNTRALAIGDSTLTLLDGDRNYVTGPLADYFVLQPKSAQADSAKKDWSNFRRQGIDFRATGNEPFWDLNIDFSKMIRFKTLNGDSISVPVPQMQQDTTSKARMLNAETESGSLRIKLYPTGCVDNMSGEIFTHGVNVEYGGKTYRGCGNFINPKYKLNDFWTLKSINGTEINSRNSERKIPALQFNLSEEKVYGNTGCNQLNGSIALEDSSLSFTKMVTTKMACPGDMESKFMDAIQQVERYSISNAELLLEGGQDTLMVFRRAE